MASANTVLKQLLGVKSIVVEGYDFFDDQDAVKHLRIPARPAKWHENRCPFCHRRCPGYDRPAGKSRIWRGSDWNGILVEIEASTCRIQCPEHGVVTADVPWAYPESGFTKEFDRNVAWLATHLPRSTVSEPDFRSKFQIKGAQACGHVLSPMIILPAVSYPLPPLPGSPSPCPWSGP